MPGCSRSARPGLLEERRELVPHAHDAAGRVRGAEAVVGLVAVEPGLGVGLAAVGVQDEDLHILGRQVQARPLEQQPAGIDGVAGLILDAEAPADRRLAHFPAARDLHQLRRQLLAEVRFRGACGLRLRRRGRRRSRGRQGFVRLQQHHVLHPPALHALPQQAQAAARVQQIQAQHRQAQRRQPSRCPHVLAPSLYGMRGGRRLCRQDSA